MLVSVFLTTLYSVWDPRSDARSSPSSPTLRPRYSVSSAAAEPSRRPLMASTSATLLAFGTASPPWLTGGRGPRPRLPHTKTDGPEDRPTSSTPPVTSSPAGNGQARGGARQGAPQGAVRPAAESRRGYMPAKVGSDTRTATAPSMGGASRPREARPSRAAS